nr:MAG TPA: hypothetical protein [Inoviridae sp.]
MKPTWRASRCTLRTADYEHSGKTYSKEIKLKQGIETDMDDYLTPRSM